MSASKSIGWIQPMKSKSPVPLAGRRAIQTPPSNTSSRKRQSDFIDCKGRSGRDVSTSSAICASIFREDFVSEDSAKVEPAYSRFLETIHEENEEETDRTGGMEEVTVAKKTLSVDPGWLVEKTKLIVSIKALI